MATNGEMPEGEWPRLDKQTRRWVCDDPACTRSAPCRSHLGKRNRRKGKSKQREARKAIERTFDAEAARFVGQLGNEEAWHGLPIRVEVKAGAQVGPIATRWRTAQEQSERSRATGDVRPFVLVAMPDGWGSDGLVVIRLSELGEVLAAMEEA